MNEQLVGFASDEVRTSESTRATRLKWVIVVDRELSAGRVVNAASCVAAATAAEVSGLLARGGLDGDGSPHRGLPWSGCAVLAAESDKLRQVRAKAEARIDIFVADMPVAAQETRVYDEYLDDLATTEGDKIEYAAVSLVGPRKRVDRIVGGLALLT